MADLAAYSGRARNIVGYALQFAALTAARPGNVAEAEWSEIDLDAAKWSIPPAKMKMDKPHDVPLSRQALALLRKVEALTGERRHVFSVSRDVPISDNTMNKALRLLGYDTANEHCAHGFRSTFSTLLNG
jgi:integrase